MLFLQPFDDVGSVKGR